MGWVIYGDRRIKTYADEKAEIIRLCEYETETQTGKVVKCSKVGSVWYAAVKVRRVDDTPIDDATYVTDADGSITFAAIVLTRYDDGCFGYKDMEESMGPVESRAPARLLDCLSELKGEDTYAYQWRQRCRDWANIPRYDEGDTIRLARAVKLTDGSSCQIVTVASYPTGGSRKRCYRIKETDQLVRLSKGCLLGSELISTRLESATPVLAEFRALQRS